MEMHGLHYQRGQSLVEHVVLWPALVILVLGTMQLTLLYRDKATLNDAVFRAAREGSLNHADANTMNRAMVQGLVPLYLKKDPSVVNYLRAEGVAYLDNQINPVNGARIGDASVKVEIISPTREVFDVFAKNMYQLQDGCESDIRSIRNGNDRTRCREERHLQIPNDNLNIRSPTQRNISIDGETVRMHIQDANLLKVRGHWCAPMTVPLMGAAFYHTLSRVNMMWDQSFWAFYNTQDGVRDHPHWSACVAKTARNAVLSEAGVETRKFYIPISSDSVVRMQSAIRM